MRSTRPASLGRLPAGPGRLDIALVLLALLVVTSCRQRELRDAGAPGSPGLAAQPQPPGPAPALDPAQDDDQDGTRDDNRDQPVQVLYPITPGTFAAAAAELHGAVVNIRSTRPAAGGPASIYPGAPPDPSLGSGVIIDRAGYILTNHHIIAQANDIRVVLHSGTELGAAVAGTDPRTDIALLTLSDPLPRDAAIAQLGDSDHLIVGQWVLALGSPFPGELSASAGIITSQGQRGLLLSPPYPNLRGFIQTDAAIHPGNTGGPLIDLAGNVIGIASAAEPRGSRLGYAVPITQVKDIVRQLSEHGAVSRTWLGIFFHPVKEADAAARGLEKPAGALISTVIPGGPAAKAGLTPGDIILSWNGRPVDHDTLPALVRSASPGMSITLTIWRDAASREIPITIEAMRE